MCEGEEGWEELHCYIKVHNQINFFKKINLAHSFNISIWKEDLYEFQASMVYTVSSRSSRLHALKKFKQQNNSYTVPKRRFSQELNYTGSLISNFKY